MKFHLKKALIVVVAVFVSTSLPSLVLAESQPIAVIHSTPMTPSCSSVTQDLWYGTKDSAANGPVTNLQAFLHAYGYLHVQPTGYFGPLTLASVKAFQQKTGVITTGYFGPLTRTQMSKITCGDTTPAAQDVTVSVSTDKDQYALNDTIHITITATNTTDHEVSLTFKNGCHVNYTFGDYNDLMGKLCTQDVASNTLAAHDSKAWTLTYNIGARDTAAGVYTLQGTVVGYGTAAKTITISNTKNPSVTVFTPNGGEVYKIGSTTAITWDSYFPYPTFAPIAFTLQATRQYVCTTEICPLIAYAPVTIVKNVTGNSYSWTVGSSSDSTELAAGDYSLQVCMSGLQTCDQTDSTFTISE